MNYFSKYIRKFQAGGPVAEPTKEDQQLFAQTLLVCPEAYASLAQQAQMPISEEFLSGIAQAQGDQNVFGQLIQQYPEDIQACYALFSQAKDQIVAAAQQKVQSMRMGGKVAYLNCLKKGGNMPCNCQKLDDGGDIEARIRGSKCF